MGKHINTFIGGMDKDTSKHKYNNSKYVDANNVRPLTDDGLSSGALENVSGNKFVIDFKEILGMSIIDITAAVTLEDGVKTIDDFFIDTGYPQTSIVAFNITFTTATELLNKIEGLIQAKNSTLPLQLQYKIGVLNSIDRIAIYNFATPIQSISADSYHIPEIYTITRDFIVIGSTELRDDVILFTENQTGPRNFGQIWRFSYDVARPEDPAYYSLVLLYNGAIDLSVKYPIEAKSRYENVNVQRVYWTDNKNVLRGANIADPNLFAFREQEFSLSPETTLSPAIAGRKSHSNGNLDSGIWYITYKLGRIGGGITSAAPFSAGIPVILDDPSVGVGGGDTDYHKTNYSIISEPTTKSIEFTIYDIPKGHDQITIYAVHEPEPGNFTAYLYDDTFISDNQKYEITLSNVELKEVVPVSSLTDTDIDFDKVKTITIKDNALLVGNVSVGGFNIELDTRAYRFTNSPGKKTYIGEGNNFQLSGAQQNAPDWLIGETDDVVNPYNNDLTLENLIASGRSKASLEYSYQIDGVTRGGTGPNVSYEFVSTQFLMENSYHADPKSSDNFGIAHETSLQDVRRDINYNSRAPFVNVPATEDVPVNINGENVDVGPGFPNFKNPTFEANFKGYMRDEVYRFGIVFYSKSGKASEVKWIGDIRFPCAGDGEERSNGFIPLSLGQYSNGIEANAPFDLPAAVGAKIPSKSGGGTWGNSIGIKFTVDISSIKDNISGYSIVRAPRREKDRTIIAEGVMHTVEQKKRPMDVRQSSVGGNLNTRGEYVGKGIDFESKLFHREGWCKSSGLATGVGNSNGSSPFPVVTVRMLREGWWKGEKLTSNDLYIKDEIKSSTSRFDRYANGEGGIGGVSNLVTNNDGINYANSNRKNYWRMGTIDCPDLKLITGAKLNGFKNRTEDSLESENDYRIKPVSLYSASRDEENYGGGQGEENWKDISVTSRIRDEHQFVAVPASVGVNGCSVNNEFIGKKVDNAEDLYSKSTALINSTSMWNRYSAARDFGKLKDIFFVDHGNGADSFAKIEDYAGGDRRFYNAGIRDIIGWPGGTGWPYGFGSSDSGRVQEQTFGGIGTRTILFNAHDWLFCKRIINAAGGLAPSNQNDPYYLQNNQGGTAANFLHRWGYKDTNIAGTIGGDKPHGGMYAIVDITRVLEAQYGGDKYFNRQESEYITTNNFVNVKKANDLTGLLNSEKVYGGDIVTSLWTEKKFYAYTSDPASTNAWAAAPPDVAGQQSGPYRLPAGNIRGIVIPLQTIINTELRPLINFNNYNSTTISAGDIHSHRTNPDEYAIPVVFHKENTLQNYLVTGAGVDFVNEYDNRVYMSNTKTNGELLDNWAVFEALKYKDVNGEYGPINKLETFNDNVVFFQDKAFGTLAVNPRSVIQDAGGNDLTFGVGGGIVDFNYISNSIGSTHQWGIQRTHTGIYFFDSLHKKMYVFAGQTSPISDIKGMSSWFYNQILGDAISKDNPILFQGMHTAYDQRFNEVIFTFHFYTDVLRPNERPSIEDLLADLANGGGAGSGGGIGGGNGPVGASFVGGESVAPVAELHELNTISDTANNNSAGNNNSTLNTTEVTCPPFFTTIHWAPALEAQDIYKIAMSGTLINQVQNEISTGSKLFMTLPFSTDYVEVTINSNISSNSGFLFVDSLEMSPWKVPLSRFIKTLPIQVKCLKTTKPDVANNSGAGAGGASVGGVAGATGVTVVNVKPVNDITSVTVSDSIITSEVDANPRPNERVSYTIVYNELTKAFTSFYSHWPRHYFSNGRRIFSQDPGDSKIYIHDEGNKGQFYGAMYDSSVELMIAPPGTHTKVFNNIEFNSQVYNTFGENLTDVTIDRARFFNEYQDSQIINFIPNINIKRRMRTWRLQIPRDTDDRSSRMRNPYMSTRFSFENTANRRIVLHDTTTHYTDTPM